MLAIKQRYAARFESLLAAIPIQPQITLNAGCGLYLEAASVRARWPDALHLGVDVALDDLHQVKPGVARIQAKLEYLPLRCCTQVVLVRHPDIIRRRAGWAHFFQHLPSLVSQGGYLLVTTYSPLELETLTQLVNLPRHPLTESQLASVNLAGQDKYPLLYRI